LRAFAAREAADLFVARPDVALGPSSGLVHRNKPQLLSTNLSARPSNVR